MDHVLSVCTGIGGLDLGLTAGLRAVGRKPRTICMVEREAFAVAILGKAIAEGRMDEAPVWLGDLRELPSHELPRVDWITGGYPCQPFSHAGKRLGEDDPRHLWPVIFDLIRTLRPRGVFFENVAGHTSLGLDRVLRDLAGCGFRSAFGLFTAEEVGAPHRRERVFILGLADAESVGGRKGGAERSGRVRLDPFDGGGPYLAEAAGKASGMADAGGEGSQGLRGECQLAEGRGEVEAHGRRDALADPDGRGGREDQLLSQLRPEGTLEPSRDGRRARAGEAGEDQIWRGWPSRPSEPQADWEPPRTIERDLGRDADGLPDRVDRLRALGNAVVPQQAERAFITLYGALT